MHILVLGSTGQVATELHAAAPPRGHTLTALSRQDADLADPEAVARTVAAAAPFDILINAAAYTAVDKAEEEEAVAHAVNALSVEAAGRACAARGAPMIHISTDYVFNGEKHEAYTEDDPVGPVSAYGRTKLEGEQRLAAALERHVIVRTAWVYSPYGKNFLKTMLRLGAERNELRVVDDQRGCPTAASDIANALLTIAEAIKAGPPAGAFGIFHYCGDGETTWRGFADEIFAQAQAMSGAERRPVVHPIATRDYPTPARRPANSALDCSKIQRVYGITPRPWREAMGETLRQLGAGA